MNFNRLFERQTQMFLTDFYSIVLFQCIHTGMLVRTEGFYIFGFDWN